MSEPTIDELDAWVRGADHSEFSFADQRAFKSTIRAILEQYREQSSNRQATKELAAIRAFVERVEKRLPSPYHTGREADSWLRAYRQAVHAELAALEQEAE